MSSRFVIGASAASSGGKRTLSRFVSFSSRPPIDQSPSFGMSARAASSSAVALVGLPEAAADLADLADAGDLAEAATGLPDAAAGLPGAPPPFDVVGERGVRAGATAARFREGFRFGSSATGLSASADA